MTKELYMKKLLRIHQSSDMHWVGNGFPVNSVFDYNGLGRELSPFLLLDYAAPYEFPPGDEQRGVGGHPHKGFETVTLVYQGELEHRDSHGGGGKIGPGDVQWMTAGRGIIHEEFHSTEFTRRGGPFQVVQLWVNLRAKDKTATPGYQSLLKAAIPNVALAHGAEVARIIAGEYAGQKGAAKTFTPINLWDVNLHQKEAVTLPLPDGHTTVILVLEGEVEVEGKKAGESDLVIFDRSGESITLKTNTNSHLLVMSGAPIDEPIVGRGPFVMNSQEEIAKAFEEYRNGRMGELNAGN